MGESTAGTPYTATIEFAPEAAVAGTLTLNVSNSGSVIYATDYTTSPAVSTNQIQLPVAAGATSVTFDINVLNDGVDETNQEITFTMATPPGPATMLTGTNNVFVLRIVDGTLLERGDLAIIAVNANTGDGDDEISFVCFKDLTSGTTIDMTENAYNKCKPGLATGSPAASKHREGGFGQGEGWLRMTFQSGADIPAGTVIIYSKKQHELYTLSNW